MPKDSIKPVNHFETENTGGVLSGFLAEEEDFDRRALWRLGTWGAAAVGAVIVAVLANQSSIGLRREQVAAADLARQSLQIQSVAKESQNETRRLASAIDTLNGDRDRLYSRVSVLEQGLESMTGAIARQQNAGTTAPQPAPPPASSAAPAPSAAAELPPVPQNPTPSPAVAPVATTVATTADKPKADAKPPEPAPASVAPSAATTPAATIPAAPPPAANPPAANTPAANPPAAASLMASKSIMAPPDAVAGKLIEPSAPAKPAAAASAPDVVASAPSKDSAAKDSPAKDGAEPNPSPAPPSTVAVQRTEFAVDVGGANSLGGLRALWRGLLKSRSNAPLAALHPIIVVKETNTGLGMQLRLVAGPLSDAAAAAKICAAMIESDRACETTVYDGQRLALNTEDPPAPPKSGSGKTGSDKPSSDKPVSEKPGPAKPDSDKAASVQPDAEKHTASNPVVMRPGSGKPYAYRRHTTKREVTEEPPEKKPESTASTISSFFSRR